MQHPIGRREHHKPGARSYSPLDLDKVPETEVKPVVIHF